MNRLLGWILVFMVFGSNCPAEQTSSLNIISSEKLFVDDLKCNSFKRKYSIVLRDSYGVVRVKLKAENKYLPGYDERCFAKDRIKGTGVPEYIFEPNTTILMSVMEVICSNQRDVVTLSDEQNFRIILEVYNWRDIINVCPLQKGGAYSSVQLRYSTGVFLGQAR